MMKIITLLALLASVGFASDRPVCKRGEYCLLQLQNLKPHVQMLEATATADVDAEIQIEQSESRHGSSGYVVGFGIPQSAPLGKYKVILKYWTDDDDPDWPGETEEMEFDVVPAGRHL